MAWPANPLVAVNLREFSDPPNIDAGAGVPLIFAEMAQAELYAPQYRQNTNADVVRIAGVDTLKASKMLTGWREQGLLVALPGRAKRNMLYTKPSAADSPLLLLSPCENNNGKEG